jgi:hypothetical protein
MVDEFILFDDVQYAKNDWRNRNKIKTREGLRWLTIPVTRARLSKRICDTVVSDPAWNRRHWQRLVENYARAPYFAHFKDFFADVYLSTRERYLSEINYKFLQGICQLLGITTKITWSCQYPGPGRKTERVLDICKQAGATEYLSGPAAKKYLDEDAFPREGIRLRYMDYAGYPEYSQLFGPFEHGVTVLDLLFNTGPAAIHYLKQGGAMGPLCPAPLNPAPREQGVDHHGGCAALVGEW